MPCFLYCVTQSGGELAATIGVGEQPVIAHDSAGLRVYWSEVANPDALSDGPSKKLAEQKYQQVLREIINRSTAIAFPFPAVVTDLESLDKLIADERGVYEEALLRLADTIQYELTATWAVEEQTDLSTPVSGREYLKRRQEAEARVAAIDAKLKSVTDGVVREWRSRQDRRRHLWFALIARDERERFIAALRSAGPSEGVRLRLSGPWPPNEFVKA
ncbi:MAG: GvpL/GvpF family gas vesicle protein [Candidatus Korobacteraceae bacterium]